jgi:DNA (cytosine-5)-methyltransferase 1
MEARRAQGFIDYEPLIGEMAKQWKIVGNSVARQMSLALGMQVREAWLANDQSAVDRIMKPPQPVRLVGTTAEVVVYRHK